MADNGINEFRVVGCPSCGFTGSPSTGVERDIGNDCPECDGTLSVGTDDFTERPR